jgi:hypothetical protein
MDWRGTLNEPYCSLGCKLLGGNEAARATTDGRAGDCAICGRSLTASPAARTCTIVPFGGELTFICSADTDHGKALLSRATTCSKCGASLD